MESVTFSVEAPDWIDTECWCFQDQYKRSVVKAAPLDLNSRHAKRKARTSAFDRQ